MILCGLNKTTLLDYPGHVAACVFTGGCNFRCPFCHNAGLVLNVEEQEQVSEEEFFSFLGKRKGVIEGVCITGGEPTLQKDLKEFIRKIKEYGLLVKLDTNGYCPEVLGELLEEGLLDYVAMDVKASKDNYGHASGVANIDIAKINKSIAYIMNSNIPYEFRTTVVKGIHEIEEFAKIGEWIQGAKAYYLQYYRENENVLTKGFSAFTKEEMEEMKRKVTPYVENTFLRGEA